MPTGYKKIPNSLSVPSRCILEMFRWHCLMPSGMNLMNSDRSNRITEARVAVTVAST